MDLRARNKLRSKLNSKEWITKSQERQKCLKKNQTENLPSKKMRLDKVDKFCWVCHTVTKQGKVCSQCPKVYHTKCIKSPTFFDGEGSCMECQQESIIGDEGTSFSCSRLKELLMYSIDRVLAKKKQLKETFNNWPEHENNNKLYKIVDINYYCQELISNSYKKPVEFLTDFKWLYHNSCIIYGDKSKYALGAEQLVKKLQEELSSLEACADCYFYRNSNVVDEATFFSLTCSKPHEVIWAKVKGYTYWPAKCLKVTKNGSAHIVFFGTHEFGYVPASMWFSLSSKPSSSQSLQQQSQYCAAIMELLDYNENLREQQYPTLHKGKNSSDAKKVSIGTQTSKDIQVTTMDDGNDCEPEIVCVTSIKKFQEASKLNKRFIDLKPDLTGSFTANEIASVSMTFCEEDKDSTQMSGDEDIQELLFIPKRPQTVCNKPGIESTVVCDGEDIQELPMPKTSPDRCHAARSTQIYIDEDIQELLFIPKKSQTGCDKTSTSPHERNTARSTQVSSNEDNQKLPVPNIPDDDLQQMCSRISSENVVPNIQSSLNLLSDIPITLSNPISEHFKSKYSNNFSFHHKTNDKQFLNSKTPSESHNSCASNYQSMPNNLKDSELTGVNLDTATLAKVISNTDPQFSMLFHEKSKELIESMMVHMWTKLNSEIKMQDATATLTTLMEEARALKQIEEDRQKLQALEEREKELQSRLNNTNFLVQCLRQSFKNQAQVIEERDKILSEMKIKLTNIKTEKAEITEKYNMEKVLNGTSST